MSGNDSLGFHEHGQQLKAISQTRSWSALKSLEKPKVKRKVTTEQEKAEQKRKRQAREEVLEEIAKKSIHIGVDFGTTYSGIGWICSADPNGNAEIVQNWGSGDNRVQEKIPTRIAYAEENDFDQTVFGNDVASSHNACSWFKLGLDSSTVQTDFDDPLLFESQGRSLMHCPDGKTYQELTQDYLHWLYERVLKSMRDLIASAVDATPLHFHITVPATWSYGAREATRQAAQAAGFGTRVGDSITVMDEPEAAAIYAIKSNTETFQQSTILKRNTTITCVDAGGGTVDLISYKIVQTDPLQLEEACIGKCAKIGSTTIDRNLHELLTTRFGAAFTTLPERKRGVGSPFMDAFEKAKRNFNPMSPQQHIELPLKMRLDTSDKKFKNWYDFEEDTVIITSEELAKMFDIVTESIIGLVEDQIRGISLAEMPDLKAIILCGGLGSSAYVETCLRKFCSKELKGKVHLLMPKRPWSSVQRGAALRGIGKPPVLYRRSRDHIGILVHKRFDKDKHDEEFVYFDEILQERRVSQQFQTLIKRGERVTPNLKKTIECFHIIKRKDRRQKFVIKQGLYSCSEKDEPVQKDGTVKKIGEIEINLSAFVHEMRFKKGVKQNLEIELKIMLTVGSDKGTLMCTAKVGMRRCGSTQIVYEADPAWKGRLVGEKLEEVE